MGPARSGQGRATRRAKGATRAPTSGRAVYRLKVTLRGIRPRIWRRLLVPADMTLAQLHDVLQVAMGWHGGHLHQFHIGGEIHGVPSPEDDITDHDERKSRLGAVAGDGDRFVYEYDFGDGWEHEIVVEKTMAPEKGVLYPVCVGGERACPPEDCGGAGGYQHLLAVLADPKHEEHEDLTDWVGGEFDAEAFDVTMVNAALGRIGKRRTAGMR